MGQVTIKNISERPYLGGLTGGGMISIRPGDVATVDEADGEQLLAHFPTWFERVPSHGQEPAGVGPVSAGEGNENQISEPAAPPLAPTPTEEVPAATHPETPKETKKRTLGEALKK